MASRVTFPSELFINYESDAAVDCIMNLDIHRFATKRPSSERCNRVKVRFHLVNIIEYPSILGLGACPEPALTLGWEAIGHKTYDLNQYETKRPVRKRGRDLILSSRARLEILRQAQLERMVSLRRPNAALVDVHQSCMGELKQIWNERPAMSSSTIRDKSPRKALRVLPNESSPLQIPVRRRSIVNSNTKTDKPNDSIDTNSTAPPQRPMRRRSMAYEPALEYEKAPSSNPGRATLKLMRPDVPKRASSFDGSQPLDYPIRRRSNDGDYSVPPRRLVAARSA